MNWLGVIGKASKKTLLYTVRQPTSRGSTRSIKRTSARAGRSVAHGPCKMPR